MLLSLRAVHARPQALVRCFSKSHSFQKPQPFFNTLWAAQRSHEHDLSDPSKRLRLLILGKPGAGKGTLSARLVKKYDIQTISTGDLLRKHISERTDVGLQAEEIVAHGGLIPDDLMLKVLTTALGTVRNQHWILDGFPRTLAQGELLDSYLQHHGTPLTLVVNLDVADEIILSRISDRWIHLPSGRVYNMSYNRPKVDGIDDITGEPLVKRPDDNPEIFARRLSKFYEATSPLLTYYTACSKRSTPSLPDRHPNQHPHQLSFPSRSSHRLLLESISGRTSDEIWPKLDNAVRKAFPSLKERKERRDSGPLSPALLAGVADRRSIVHPSPLYSV